MGKFNYSNLLIRLISGLVMIITFIVSLFYNDYLFLTIMFVASFLAFFELVKMQKLNVQIILLNIFLVFFLVYFSTNILSFLSVFIIFVHFIFFPSINFLKLKEIFFKIIPAFYILPFFLSLIVLIPEHKLLLLLVFIGIWSVDIGGYIFGKFFGRHKIFPTVSPKKTYEGLFGSLIFLVFIQSLSWYFFDILSFREFSIIILLTFIGSIYGDYFESFLKRKYRIKDSGNLIPGHGGILDRLDSTLYTIPLITILCTQVLN